MRVVLDTNVLVSGLISREGIPGRLLAAVKRTDLTLVTSAYQLDELREVPGRDHLKSYIRPEEAYDLLYNLESVGVVVTDLPEIDLSPDQKDNPILAAGITGRADLIVSGDKKDMLALGHAGGIPIISPAEAIERLRQLSR